MHVHTTQLLTTIGAAARLTRLVTRDTITQPLRDRLLYNPQQRAAITRGVMVPRRVLLRAARIRAWA